MRGVLGAGVIPCPRVFGGLAVGAALATRDDVATAGPRRLVQRERDGQVAARPIALASALDV